MLFGDKDIKATGVHWLPLQATGFNDKFLLELDPLETHRRRS
jgi:hypothetical protein